MTDPLARIVHGGSATADPSAALAQRTDVWRGRRSDAPMPATASGHPGLDDHLPGRGWPRGALCELLHEDDGVGELALLLPALARLGNPRRPVVWVAPPYPPCAPALRQQDMDLAGLRVIETGDERQALWAAEQCLRAGCCSAVLVWPRHADGTALRRLQLAAETGRCHGFVFRHSRHGAQASPAPVRLRLWRERGDPVLRIDKCRGRLSLPAGAIAWSRDTGARDMPAPRAEIIALPAAAGKQLRTATTEATS